MHISIVTDELSGDPETAFELGLEWGVDRFELRGVYGDRVPRISDHARHRLVRAVRDFGVKITAVSPGLFKLPYPSDQPGHSNLGWMDAGLYGGWRNAQDLLDDHHSRLLPETIEFAAEIGAPTIICFSFSRAGATQGAAPSSVVDMLAAAAERCSAAGIDLLVETEEGHWADTGERSAEFVRRVGNGLGVNWDPANALIDGDVPWPTGYDFVGPYVRNVHFKDARVYPSGRWELLAEGDVDWRGQIAALAASGYRGSIAIEPHLSPCVASTRNALDRLRALIEETSPVPLSSRKSSFN